MKLEFTLQGVSPGVPFDTILGCLSQHQLSGFLRGVTREGEKIRLVFLSGRLLPLHEDEDAEHFIAVLRRLLATTFVWGFEPADVTGVSSERSINVQSVLLNLARAQDEASRLPKT